MSTPSVLVVSATAVEAAHVPQGYEVLLTGIGKTAAATAVAARLATGPRTEMVVNIGTAGALHPGMSGLYEIGRVLNHDINADDIRALGYDPHEWLDLDPAQPTRLATGDMFVSNASVRDRLALVADLVDMEGYAVAYACQAAGVPVRLVKHVSDSADESAKGWAHAVDNSARALAEWLVANHPA